MELMIFVMIFILIVIMTKLSNIETQLNRIESGLRVVQRVSKTTVKQEFKEEEFIKKEPIKKELVKKVSVVEKASMVEKKITPKAISSYTKSSPIKTSSELSLEELFFGNIILKISIVAFILGIGLFFKYSIDRDWIPMWLRVFSGVAVGVGMLIGGSKMIDNRHKLFSEVLFGGGVAILYLSIFASFTLGNSALIGVEMAFVLMVAITVLAGILSLRFDAKSTAVFGLIGGFATPFLLGAGSGDYVGVLSYMLMLNLGVLYVSIYKNWAELSWLAFVITAFTQLSVVWDSEGTFFALFILFALFFVIYSIVPFINEIQEKKEHLAESSVALFWVNSIVVILSFLSLFKQYDIALIYYIGVTLPLSGYLFAYASFLKRESIPLKELVYAILAQAIALLLVTPFFIFDGSSLSMVLAVESLMLLWVGVKSDEQSYGLFALIGFGITGVRYLFLDMMHNFSSMETSLYIETLAVTSFFVIGSIFMGYRLMKNSKLDLEYGFSTILLAGGAWLLFLFFNVEIYNILKLSSPLSAKFAITLLWVVFGIAMFVYGRVEDIETSRTGGTALISIAILKAFFFDLANLDSIYRIVLFLILGAILFALSYFYQKDVDARR